MQRCSVRAFAMCPYRHECGTIHEATFTDNSDCAEFNRKVDGMPMNKGDRIRTMTDEELAKWLIKAHDGDICIPFCTEKPECCEALDTGVDIPNEACVACMMHWIQQPAEEESK